MTRVLARMSEAHSALLVAQPSAIGNKGDDVAGFVVAGQAEAGCEHRTAITLAEMRELYAGPFPDPQGDPREAEAG